MLGKCTQTQMRNHAVSFQSKNYQMVKAINGRQYCQKINTLRVSNQMKVDDYASGNTQKLTTQKSVVHFGVDNSMQDNFQKMDEEFFSFDLDIAPGAGGKKQFPSDDEDDEEFETVQNEGHTLNSTKKCYEEFPFLIKASCPLDVPQDDVPVGDTLSTCPDAGPGTGKRRFPSDDDIDASSTSHQRANHLNTKEDNLREVALRRSC
eukprot:TRINITY_DN17497_c0_g1_i1.p2 TRINITY_DN17497_c0_g1~~TRINITY_DN17497_c0_g1_i1.p2  ORF type:complete len:206 (+),score=35.08 TRINITY_DN17497_c0_g1_i1:108-725(+)